MRSEFNGCAAPKEGWIKFNMDAAVSENFTALAVVVRDKSGCEAPKEGWIKLNVDAAVSENLTALAVVVRDKNGDSQKSGLKLMNGAPWCKLKLQLCSGQSS